MKSSVNLEKWKKINSILIDNLFELKHVMGNWRNFYYNETSECWVLYDVSDDELKIIDSNNKILTVLSGDNLNEFTISQEIIEHVGK